MHFVGFPDMDEGYSFSGSGDLQTQVPKRLVDGPNIEYDYDYETKDEIRIQIPERFLGALQDSDFVQIHESSTLQELLSSARSKARGDELWYIKNLEDRVFIGRYFESTEDKMRKSLLVKERLLTFLQNAKDVHTEVFTSMNREPLDLPRQMKPIQREATYETGFDYKMDEYGLIKVPERFCAIGEMNAGLLGSLCNKSIDELLLLAFGKATGNEEELIYIEHLRDRIEIGDDLHTHEKAESIVRDKLQRYLQSS